jgi:hypothetical protein
MGGQGGEILSFHTPVRGYAFAAVPPPADAHLEPGAAVLLLREPENPADRLAVGVWLIHAGQPRWRLGYLDRTVAARVAPRLDAGAQVDGSIDGWVEEPEGRWRRPLLQLTVRAAATSAAIAPPVGESSGRRTLSRMPPGVARRRVARRGR